MLLLLLLLFLWTVQIMENSHVMLCVLPLELGIWTLKPCTLMCGPLSWGYGLTIRTPIQDASLWFLMHICCALCAKGHFKDYELGANDGAHKGRIHHDAHGIVLDSHLSVHR